MKWANMDASKPVKTPFDMSNISLNNPNQSLSDFTVYHQIDNHLQYLEITRPDIAFSVDWVTQFMHNPTPHHWKILKRIICNLVGTIHYDLWLYNTHHLDLNVYYDANLGKVTEDKKSTTNYAIFMGPNLVSWSSSE